MYLHTGPSLIRGSVRDVQLYRSRLYRPCSLVGSYRIKFANAFRDASTTRLHFDPLYSNGRSIPTVASLLLKAKALVGSRVFNTIPRMGYLELSRFQLRSPKGTTWFRVRSETYYSSLNADGLSLWSRSYNGYIRQKLRRDDDPAISIHIKSLVWECWRVLLNQRVCIINFMCVLSTSYVVG